MPPCTSVAAKRPALFFNLENCLQPRGEIVQRCFGRGACFSGEADVRRHPYQRELQGPMKTATVFSNVRTAALGTSSIVFFQTRCSKMLRARSLVSRSSRFTAPRGGGPEPRLSVVFCTTYPSSSRAASAVAKASSTQHFMRAWADWCTIGRVSPPHLASVFLLCSFDIIWFSP